MDFIGVDYGSKLAGTTALCYFDEGLQFLQSLKGKDADAFLSRFISEKQPGNVFIDAPLSLPKAYINAEAGDFFYRKCDRELKAMSPMFLGGLTARAIKLKVQQQKAGVWFYESYPRGLVDELSKNNPKILDYYKTDIQKFIGEIVSGFDLKLKMTPENRHQADALLAYLIGRRVSEGKNHIYGDPDEGLIYV